MRSKLLLIALATVAVLSAGCSTPPDRRAPESPVSEPQWPLRHDSGSLWGEVLAASPSPDGNWLMWFRMANTLRAWEDTGSGVTLEDEVTVTVTPDTPVELSDGTRLRAGDGDLVARLSKLRRPPDGDRSRSASIVQLRFHRRGSKLVADDMTQWPSSRVTFARTAPELQRPDSMPWITRVASKTGTYLIVGRMRRWADAPGTLAISVPRIENGIPVIHVLPIVLTPESRVVADGVALKPPPSSRKAWTLPRNLEGRAWAIEFSAEPAALWVVSMETTASLPSYGRLPNTRIQQTAAPAR